MKATIDSKTSDSFLISTQEVWEHLRIGKNLFFKLKSSGQIGPLPIRTLGSKVLWNRKEIGEWADAGCPSREQWQNIRAEKK
jgi:predicted DNA-binding transcriptional regulator AlpA